MKLFCCIAISTLLLTPAVRNHSGQVDPRAQQQADAQLALPILDPRAVVSVNLTAAPLGTVLDAIAKAAGITVRYDSANFDLSVLTSVKLADATADQALRGALDGQALTFKVTGTKSVMIYPDTPAGRAKYTESIRTFTLVNADANTLGQVLNQALTGSTVMNPLRPVIVTNGDRRTIMVRATADAMAEIARIIAANDK